MPGDVGGADRGEIGDSGLEERLRVPREVSPIGGEGVAGQPTLDGQMVEIGVDGPIDAQLSTSLVGRTGMPCASATGP